ncbi:hypothetical protein GUITHDRAFT_109385 [Guillardia theta CCMP2712]|uniref:Uncharacterized protein n=1 Tax=Guillardia theta (strain CCMP2712) TaxID=905079 RepID=L1J921_GUITC|nr:hypothetical protein GUITHDRAFT_109385 [Guillardia theta CCMP2712]EKX44609.1 hypothetical protein GUITHDRAFT_109385 [Guillardia theta CCMP2712]|eukprot:XP_005831589.1 hypothetical protein GUITHDRAFT_109385 [Guillardia theta CCMP2712]
MEALLEAAAAGDEAKVDAMLGSSADPNWTDESGWSPLIMAAKANPNYPSFHNRTALMGACMNGYEDVVKTLLESQADPSIRNDENENALDLAKKKSFNKISNLISIALEMDNVRNRRWREESSFLCHDESIRSEINLEVGGKTLLDFAFETGNSELVAILIGFNATRGNLKDQWSPQDSLMEEGKQEIPEKVSESLRILVIGGTQFMGRQTVEELVAAGHEGLGNAPTHYILISTDSVYMACLRTSQSEEGGVKEESAQRPPSEEHKEELRLRSPYQYEYGSRKLECEESLKVLHDKMVYSHDVVSAIIKTIEAGPRVYGLSLNIAGREQPTMKEFIEMIAEACGGDELSFDENKRSFFPSVDFGPVASSKAQEILAWQPTEIKDWIRRTTAWNDVPANAAYTMAFVRANSYLA